MVRGQRWLGMTVLVVGIGLVAAACGTGEEILLLGRLGPPANPEHVPDMWHPLTFKNIAAKTRYSIVRDGEHYVLKAESHAAASGLIRPLDLDPQVYQIVTWRWKVENVLTKGDERRKEGDDYAARLFVAFQYTPERARVWERAQQMNAGARAAQGATLLFLRADTVLPSLETQAVIREALADPGVVGWRFDVRFDSERPIFRIIAALMNLRSRLSGISTGDQALFVRRRTFEDPGGYPGIPLMEDVAFIRRLKRRGRLASLRTRVTTSARKWEREGVPRTILLLVADGSAGQNG